MSIQRGPDFRRSAASRGEEKDKNPWAKAIIEFDSDPTAQIPCPKCSEGFLKWTDIFPDNALKHKERIISCPACGAWNAARMIRKSGEGP